mmetsp:Transcript_17444/g.47411  ORF Transcript_17444/g.47411 Transcript_17444/m.47411 type:complete len:333 (+) Transcript_17444:1091-2089(+)
MLGPVDSHGPPANVDRRSALAEEGLAILVARAHAEERVAGLRELALLLAAELHAPDDADPRPLRDAVRPIGGRREDARAVAHDLLLNSLLDLDGISEDRFRPRELLPELFGHLASEGHPLHQLVLLPGLRLHDPQVGADPGRVGLRELPRPHEVLEGVGRRTPLRLQAYVHLRDALVLVQELLDLRNKAEPVCDVGVRLHSHKRLVRLVLQLLNGLAVDELWAFVLLPLPLQTRDEHLGKVSRLHCPHRVIVLQARLYVAAHAHCVDAEGGRILAVARGREELHLMAAADQVLPQGEIGLEVAASAVDGKDKPVGAIICASHCWGRVRGAGK